MQQNRRAQRKHDTSSSGWNRRQCPNWCKTCHIPKTWGNGYKWQGSTMQQSPPLFSCPLHPPSYNQGQEGPFHRFCLAFSWVIEKYPILPLSCETHNRQDLSRPSTGLPLHSNVTSGPVSAGEWPTFPSLGSSYTTQTQNLNVEERWRLARVLILYTFILETSNPEMFGLYCHLKKCIEVKTNSIEVLTSIHPTSIIKVDSGVIWKLALKNCCQTEWKKQRRHFSWKHYTGQAIQFSW